MKKILIILCLLVFPFLSFAQLYQIPTLCGSYSKLIETKLAEGQIVLVFDGIFKDGIIRVEVWKDIEGDYWILEIRPNNITCVLSLAKEMNLMVY